MEITEALLRANGWELHIFPDVYMKHVTPDTRFIAEFMKSKVRISLFVRNCGRSLPNVTSMEALTQLEFLLSEYRIVNTALIDAAIEKEFGDG